MVDYNINNKDFQFRLVKAGTKFINKVHEIPEDLKTNPQSVIMLNKGPYILHIKTKEQQLKQNEKYFNMQMLRNKPDKKIIYDSVLFTTEGITSHAKEEIYEWLNRGYDIKILDNNYQRKQDPSNLLSTCYRAIDIIDDKYLTIVNQPPSRWKQTSYLKNRIGYLAFEGKINDGWVKDINTSNMLALMTPSEYCKQCFIESGVTIPIYVIPHGVNSKFRRIPNLEKFDKFTFLWIGAPNAKRKNMEMMLKGFVKTFKDNPNVELILKINKIYDPSMNIDKEINRIVPKEMASQVKYIDEDITEEDLVNLFNQCHTYVSTSYSEGFGLNIINAIACGCPTISTTGHGADDFQKGKVTLIDNEIVSHWAPLVPPYENTKWPKPSLDSLCKALKHHYNNYDKLSKETSAKAKNLHEEWSWIKTIDKMEEVIKEIFKVK